MIYTGQIGCAFHDTFFQGIQRRYTAKLVRWDFVGGILLAEDPIAEAAQCAWEPRQAPLLSADRELPGRAYGAREHAGRWLAGQIMRPPPRAAGDARGLACAQYGQGEARPPRSGARARRYAPLPILGSWRGRERARERASGLAQIHRATRAREKPRREPGLICIPLEACGTERRIRTCSSFRS
jgi:hypothetical protein